MSKPKLKRLGDVVNFKRGYDLPASARREGPYPVVSSAGVSGFHDEFKKEGEGLVTGRYGTLGEVHYVNGRYWPHNTALYVTDFKGNHPRYVYFLMKSLGNLQTADKSAVPGINRNDLHEVMVPCHQPGEQKPIADILWSIEEKITLNQRINAELEAMAKLLYDYWFVQFDFPMSAAQAKRLGKPKLEGKPYKSSGGPMVYNAELKREVPEGWEAGTLADLGEIIGGSTPSKVNPELFTQNGTAWITPKDLSNNVGNRFITRGKTDVSTLGISSTSLKVMPPGTVLLSTRAPIGYMAIAREEVTTNQGFKSFVPNKGYSSEFIFETVRLYMPAIVGQSAGTTFKEVSKADLGAVKIALPPKALTDRLTELVAPIFQQQNVLELQNQELASLRDWLLPLLMNGQVRVAKAEETVGVAMAAEGQAPYAGTVPRTFTLEDRAAINAWVVHVSNKDHRLGRTKAEKIEHILEGHLGNDHRRDAIRDAAGPIDIKSRKAVEALMELHRWGVVVEKDLRSGGIMYQYHSGSMVGDAVKRAEALLGSDLEEAERIVRLMKPLKTERCEVVATLYAAWNDLLQHGKPAADKDIFIAASADWHENKMDIEFSEWEWGLKWLRENRLVPTGIAKPVKPKKGK
jgi:type I restriction enzyme S subunit